MPSCISCKNNANISVHDYTQNHPARYIVGLNTHYYIMTQHYICHVCKRENERQKADAEKEGEDCFEPVQYTSMGWNPESMRLLPFDQSYKFPAVLSHKAGLDRTVADMLPTLFDCGLGPEATSNLLLKNHSRKHTNDHIMYELCLEQKRAFENMSSLTTEAKMFSEFGDKALYNARVPTGCFLQAVYLKQTGQT